MIGQVVPEQCLANLLYVRVKFHWFRERNVGINTQELRRMR
jgi:hypothetical protein